MSNLAATELKENILAAIAACSDEDFNPEDFDDSTTNLVAELAAAASLAKNALVLKVVQASQLSLTDLREFTGAETDDEIVDGMIDELHAAGQTITGDVAQTSVGPGVTITGSTTTGSAVITNPSSTAGLAVGQAVSGAGIPAGSTILGLSPLTLSANATATASGITITVGETQVLGLAEWTIDWKRKTAEATTTDNAAYESSLGSTASWSVKAKYMFLVGDTTQAAAIIAAISAPQSPQQWNFFPDVTVGHPAYKGLAYIDGITISAGVGKIVGLDVSLKGTGPLTVAVQAAPQANASTITGTQAEV
jgi:hypothetical protein